MKKIIIIKCLYVLFATLTPLAAFAADPAPSGSDGARGRGASVEEREARKEQCKANPEHCKQMKEKMEKRRADKQAKFEQRFKRADSDGNGIISRAEAEKSMPRLASRFEQVDDNKDGQITKEEIAAVRRAQFEQRRRAAVESSKL